MHSNQDAACTTCRLEFGSSERKILKQKSKHIF